MAQARGAESLPGEPAPAGRSRVELLRLAFHVGNLLPDPIETQVLDQPDGAADIEISDVLPSQWNDEVPKPTPVNID